MIIVGDSSVFVALHRVDELPLLPRLFGRLHVPDAVWQEVFSSRNSSGLVSPDWLVRHSLAPSPSLAALALELDPGEAEAIELALTLHADLLLIDEQAGRRQAHRAGLNTTGLVGVLIMARQRDLIPALAPLLRKTQAAGFWLADELVNSALARVGESP